MVIKELKRKLKIKKDKIKKLKEGGAHEAA